MARSSRGQGAPDTLPPGRPLRDRVGKAGESAALAHLKEQGFRILARDWRSKLGQIDVVAEDGDTVDDATVRWPEDRPQLTFGEFSLTAIVPNNASEQQHIIFDPIPRVDGIEASADPLFEPRANVYLMSGRRRRTAGAH